MIYKTKYLAINLALLISLYPTIASTNQEIEKSLLIDELIQEHGFDEQYVICLLYTSHADDEGLRVDIGGRRNIKK